MMINGQKQGPADLTQWEKVAMHDFPFSAEESEQRGKEILEALGRAAEVGLADFEDCKVRPLIDRLGNSYQLSPREWADTLGRRAVAMRGISYAGEMPTELEYRAETNPIPTLP